MSFEYEFVSPADLPKFGVDYSRSHLWRLIQAGKFPKPERYSPRKVHWRADELRAWLTARHQTAQPTMPPSRGTIADDLKSLTPNDQVEARHAVEQA